MKTDYTEYEDKYDENNFWKWLERFAKVIGREFVFKILQIYYVLQRNDVPTKTKWLIMGALGYLISPIDVVPDSIPIIGWVDDVAAIGYVLSTVANYVDAHVNHQATVMLDKWFK